MIKKIWCVFYASQCSILLQRANLTLTDSQSPSRCTAHTRVLYLVKFLVENYAYQLR